MDIECGDARLDGQVAGGSGGALQVDRADCASGTSSYQVPGLSSVMSTDSNLSPLHLTSVSNVSHISAQHAGNGALTQTPTSSHLHTHSCSTHTTNLSLYPPPNPLAKPVLPNTLGLSRILPVSSTTSLSPTQPGHAGRNWQHKTTANHLGSVNERTVPAYQVRNNFHTQKIQVYHLIKSHRRSKCKLFKSSLQLLQRTELDKTSEKITQLHYTLLHYTQ